MSNTITLTGAFGFIGSNLVAALNKRGITPHVLIRGLHDNWRNVAGLSFKLLRAESEIIPGTLVALGADANTQVSMNRALWENNVDTPIRLRHLTVSNGGRFIYASSASVYGAEEHDFTERVEGLTPLNAYAQTKLAVDQAFFGKGIQSPETYGLRFFNVFGERENNKGNMASVIHKALHKKEPLYTRDLNAGGSPNHWLLFKSDRDITRDFVYVGDVIKVILHFIDTKDIEPGAYNVGSGRTAPFEDIVKAIDPKVDIEYTPIPYAMKSGYQHYSRADLTKLREVAGYRDEFLTIEQGIAEMKKSIIL